MDRPTRLLELVQLLGGRQCWTPREIAARFEISERTAYRDLRDLSRRFPVAQDERGGYRLLEGATIRPIAMTAAERAVLKLILENPAVRTTPDIGRTLDMVKAKLDAAARHAEETPSALVLAGPERSGAIAQGLMSMLDRSIRTRVPVSLLYRSLAGGHTKWRGIDPYAVFHRKNAWYLAGRCHLRDEPRTFRLDRISRARPLGGTFGPPEFDLDEFLEHTWELYRGRELHEIVIHFDAALAPLIEDSAYHPGQRVRRLGNGALEYRCTLSHLDEIARWIVGFAGLARAVEPPALVARVADSAILAYERHRPGAGDPSSRRRPQDGLPGLVREASARQRSLI